MESPRGNVSFEIGGTGAGGPRGAADFREEF